ncbi:MAG: DUF1420 family protein [Candidatus Binataceae bacterium]
MLDLFVLRPPLPALIGLLFTLGVADSGFRLAPVIGLKDKPLDYAAGFLIATAILCALLHPLVWIGIPHLIGTLRAIGWTIAATGFLSLPRWWRRAHTCRGWLADCWGELGSPDRAAALLVAVIIASYFLIVLGPACDGDSLNYHLGAPLDWMLHGGIYPRWDWIHSHLVGLGEMISMVGLAAGSDNTGAIFEFASLLAAIAVVTTFAHSPRERLMGALLVAACPVMNWLATWQKPELMPAVAMTAALMLIARDWEALEPAPILAASVCVALATACKYSFILTAPVVAVAGLIAAHRSRRLPIALMFGAIALIVLPMQVWVRNYLIYRDPLSPMLEFLKARPDPLALAVAHYLSTLVFYYYPPRTLWIHFFLSSHIQQFEAILGLGVFAFIPALRNRRVPAVMPAAAIAVVILALFAQRAPRFFLEPYLWIAAVAAGAPDSLIKAGIKGLLAIQGVVLAGVGIYFASVLFPGALTAPLRDYAMSRAAFFYLEARHLNTVLPHGVVLTMIEGQALVRPPFIMFDEVVFMPEAQEDERMRHYVSDGVADVLYMPRDWIDDFRAHQPDLLACFDQPMDAGVRFIHDPLRWFAPPIDETWQLFKLTPGCAGRQAGAQSGHAG